LLRAERSGIVEQTLLLAGTEIKVQQVQLAVLQQQGGIADGVVGQGVDPVVLIRVSQAYRYRQPSSSALAKLAGMMTLAILRGAAVLAEADIAISRRAATARLFSTYRAPWFRVSAIKAAN
jgi:hypothetical protein